jgi:protein-tyrosine-phosphatase
LLRQLLAETGSSRSVASAGFIGPGRPSPPPAIAEAAAFGVDLVPHRSQLLTREAVERAAVIVVMDGAQAAAVGSEFGADPNRVVVLGDLDPAPRVERRVIDPVEQPAPVFRACYERMARCLTVLANALAERGAGVS